MLVALKVLIFLILFAENIEDLSDWESDSDSEDITAAYFMDLSSLCLPDILQLFTLEEEKPLLTLVKTCDTLRLVRFVYTMQTQLSQLISDINLSKPNWTAFYSAVHNFLASDEYSKELKALDPSCSEAVRLVGFKIFSKIQEIIITDVKKEKESAVARDVRNSAIGRDNIAHIGGWAVYKILGKLRSKFNKQPFGDVGLLEDICKLKTIVDKGASNNYTDHIEYQPGAMIRLSKPAVDFFIELDNAVRTYESPSNLLVHRSNLYHYILEQLVSNEKINDMYNSLPFPEECKLTLYKVYLKMSAGQFRREVKRTVTKEIETRKAIATSSKKRKSADKAPCVVCGKHCARASVHCDFCGHWCHYRCAGLTGKEEYLHDDSEWKCPKCANI